MPRFQGAPVRLSVNGQRSVRRLERIKNDELIDRGAAIVGTIGVSTEVAVQTTRHQIAVHVFPECKNTCVDIGATLFLIQVGQVPAPISTVMITEDMRGILWWAVLFVVYWLIYAPFFKTYDRQCLAEEEAAEE